MLSQEVFWKMIIVTETQENADVLKQRFPELDVIHGGGKGNTATRRSCASSFARSLALKNDMLVALVMDAHTTDKSLIGSTISDFKALCRNDMCKMFLMPPTISEAINTSAFNELIAFLEK